MGEFLGRSHDKVFHNTGMAGMSSEANPACLTDQLGSRWALTETSFKYRASCRHTHPSAEALLQVMQQHHLQANHLARVITHVHQGAIDVLGPVVHPQTVHQSKFSMSTVLGLVARYGHAGLTEFEQHCADELGNLCKTPRDGRVLQRRDDDPKGNPRNTLSRAEIHAKALRLAAFGQGASPHDMGAALQQLWGVRQWARVGTLLVQLGSIASS